MVKISSLNDQNKASTNITLYGLNEAGQQFENKNRTEQLEVATEPVFLDLSLYELKI
jgi:hypothetical protein